MACFAAPLAEAVITTVLMKRFEKKEKMTDAPNESQAGIPWSRKLKWLNNLLWGGSALLALEHIWHGEIIPQFPFLTALKEPGGVLPMLGEIATVGVGMAAFVTLVWFFMIKIADARAKKAAVSGKTAETEPCI
ncbi:MAG TPA: hypothetical protein PLD48_05145 [Bacillota bacterium]|nr:hypothetical protein [Bacillota bacterium]HOK68050.1 hypothetical protein [Bacillota bacterium]HPP85870.1 hypothetical protein [Bacillota bacterium]